METCYPKFTDFPNQGFKRAKSSETLEAFQVGQDAFCVYLKRLRHPLLQARYLQNRAKYRKQQVRTLLHRFRLFKGENRAKYRKQLVLSMYVCKRLNIGRIRKDIVCCLVLESLRLEDRANMASSRCASQAAGAQYVESLRLETHGKYGKQQVFTVESLCLVPANPRQVSH